VLDYDAVVTQSPGNNLPNEKTTDEIGSDRRQDPPRYPISSVDNALKLLLLFREQRTIRVAEASESLGVVRSTAHRLLAMLQYRGLVQQDLDTKAYAAGPALVDIGLSVVRRMDLRRHVHPYLERLSSELGETIHLMTLVDGDCLFIDSVESPKAVRTSSRLGLTFPAHATSGGKVLLAELTPTRLAELYPSEQLAGLTSRSITTRDELLRELETVREQGYGMNRGESEDDLCAVAVLVRNAFGQARGAIAVSTPLSRFDEAAVPSHVERMRRMADEAGAQLV